MGERIIFFDAKTYDQESFDAANEPFGFRLRYHNTRLTPETAPLARDAQVICAFVNDQLTAPVIDALYQQGVRLVALRCAGYNNVDLPAAYQRIRVVRVPAYSPHAVAEHTVALMLSLNRKTHRAYYRTRDNNFNINGFLGFDLHGKTAGIIGTGKIGREVIRIMRGFGMQVLAHDPHPDKAFERETRIRYADLDTLYAQSDIISLHCPLTPENVHLINAETIGRMKKNIMLINTGRGQLIHTKDLVQALKTGHVGAAGLDVYEEEDKFFFEDRSSEIIQDDTLARLLSFPNVLVTSHQAFFTQEAMRAIALTTLESVRAFCEGAPLANEVCRQCADHPARCQQICRNPAPRKTAGEVS